MPFRSIVTAATSRREFLEEIGRIQPKSKGCAVLVEETSGSIDEAAIKAALRCSDAITFMRNWRECFAPPYSAENPQFLLAAALVVEKLESDQFGSIVLCAPDIEFEWFAEAMCIGNGAELVLLDANGPELQMVMHSRDVVTSKAPSIWRSYYRRIGPIAGSGKEAA